MRRTLLLFDFDGTLVDTLGDIAYHANAVLRQRGMAEAPLETVKRSIGLGVHELFKGVAPWFRDQPAALEEAVGDFKRRYRRQPVIGTVPFPHVTEMLRGPLAKLDKAIVTNKPQDITLEILERLGMENDFSAVIGMHAGFPAKPDPTSCRDMMQRFQASGSSTIYIGDSNVDAETSLNAGIDFAWVDYGYDRLKGHRPAFHFSSASEWSILGS